MAPGRDRGDFASPLSHLMRLGRRFFGTEMQPVSEPVVERRVSQRIPLRLPVDACLEGGTFQESKTRDVSLRGLALELGEQGAPGQRVSVRFRAAQAGMPPFLLQGRVVRVQEAECAGVNVRRTDNPQEALESYRKLVLYYLRHRPLLEELNSGYFEGRCPVCSWVGRVGERGQRCPMCGGLVERSTGAAVSGTR